MTQNSFAIVPVGVVDLLPVPFPGGSRGAYGMQLPHDVQLLFRLGQFPHAKYMIDP